MNKALKKHAIVGFGCAGYNAARSIRHYDTSAEIDVFDATGQPPFNPMLSTYYASERLGIDEVFPFGGLDEIAQSLKLNILDSHVERIDTAEKSVVTKDGTRRAYDSILIATGASALIPGFLQCAGERFFLMRTLSDAQRLRSFIEQNSIRTAVVVGGSMVGIKVAELLHARRIETTIVDAAPYLFPLAAYAETAGEVQRRLESCGVRFAFDAKVSAIDERGITLADGTLMEADIVCLCIGTQANLQLVANTEVVQDTAVNIGRGIIVDNRMQTNVPGIYAAGDCCEGMNLQTGKTAIIGLWANAGAQGSCAGANMAGEISEYYGNILHNITHFFDMDFIGLGDVSLPGERHRFDGRDFTIDAVINGGHLQSVNIFGNYKISGILKNHLTKRLLGVSASLTPVQRGLLEKHGLNRGFIDLIGDAI